MNNPDDDLSFAAAVYDLFCRHKTIVSPEQVWPGITFEDQAQGCEIASMIKRRLSEVERAEAEAWLEAAEQWRADAKRLEAKSETHLRPQPCVTVRT